MSAAAELESGQKLQDEGVGHHEPVQPLPGDHAGQPHQQHERQHQPQRGAGVLHLGPEAPQRGHGSPLARLGCLLGSRSSSFGAGVPSPKSAAPPPSSRPGGGPTRGQPAAPGRQAGGLLPAPRPGARVLGPEPRRRRGEGRKGSSARGRLEGQRSAGVVESDAHMSPPPP
ncbi:hypothetical protein VULLAG_LOCUS19023 [Vulpes lagopus]